MYPFSDKERISHWVTPSDMYVGLAKFDLFSDVAGIFADAIRNARLDAQYEMYKELAKGNPDNKLMDFEEFRKIAKERGLSALFEGNNKDITS